MTLANSQSRGSALKLLETGSPAFLRSLSIASEFDEERQEILLRVVRVIATGLPAEPAAALSPRAALAPKPAELEARLRYLTPAAYAIWRTAELLQPRLLDATEAETEVVACLLRHAPGSPFKRKFVARQAYKLINPRGHGANGLRFNVPELSWFREQYPQASFLTNGAALVMVAAIWWTVERGSPLRPFTKGPVSTADLDAKLGSLGFLKDERNVICKLIRWQPKG